MQSIVSKIRQNIFNKDNFSFEEVALAVFNFQYTYNPVYKQFTDYLRIDPQQVHNVKQIPFLPIEFFKTHAVITDNVDVQKIFESSGTTGQVTSKHMIADTSLYKQSFDAGFQAFYGDIQDYIILALLPSYLERDTSSLVYMVNDLIAQTNSEHSGFYLNNLEALAKKIQELTSDTTHKKKILLIGVTFALLDFAEQFPMDIPEVVIMETGGMKGRREEMTRSEVHDILTTAFHVPDIHSEYGMTELLSQGYSHGNGIFQAPYWMKILKRDIYDPFNISDTNGRGGLNVIDLANLYSCAFIATQDIVYLQDNAAFEVLGRLDNADIRGCNLMVAM